MRQRIAYWTLLVLVLTITLPIFSATWQKLNTGIAITPAHFPDHTASDIDNAYKMARKLGKYAVFIQQWGRYKPHIMRIVINKMRQSGLTPIIGLSPTSLDKGRKALDLPNTVRQAANSNLSFSNPVIRRAFIATAKEIARMKPDYLCLATEINFLAFGGIKEYLHYVSLYKQAYYEVKKISPKTKVFVSFQWEMIRLLDSKRLHAIQKNSKLYTVFKPELDVIGLTTYPSHFHSSPSVLPKDYYTWVYHHFSRHEKFLFMEVGWPTAKSGTPAEQAHYIRRLPELMAPLKPVVVAWSLLHDVNLKEFDANLNTTGIVYSNGRKKPGYHAFVRIMTN